MKAHITSLRHALGNLANLLTVIDKEKMAFIFNSIIVFTHVDRDMRIGADHVFAPTSSGASGIVVDMSGGIFLARCK